MKAKLNNAMQEVLNAQVDPVVNALKKHSQVVITFSHLKPVCIHDDNEDQFVATYKDAQGSYKFEIRRKGQEYIVLVDGMHLHTGSNVEWIKWNFENQLAAITTKVLG